MYWTGPKAKIAAAEAAAAAIVASQPAFRDAVEVANPTERWAIPAETTTAGVWAVPAYQELPTPDGCTEAETVTWPPSPDIA